MSSSNAAADRLGEAGRAFNAEVRARLAVERRSGAWLAKEIRRSQTYVSLRLRDEACFTLDDVALIAGALGITAHALVADANRRKRP